MALVEVALNDENLINSRMQYKAGKRYTVLSGIISGAIKLFNYLPGYAGRLKNIGGRYFRCWRPVGTLFTSNKRDHEGILVEAPFNDFRKIKLKVDNAALQLNKLRITYENGEPGSMPVVERIRRGGTSQVIDLGDAGEKHIRRIDFWFSQESTPDARARVTVFGMYPV
jgi:hypothetical protein